MRSNTIFAQCFAELRILAMVSNKPTLAWTREDGDRHQRMVDKLRQTIVKANIAKRNGSQQYDNHPIKLHSLERPIAIGRRK